MPCGDRRSTGDLTASDLEGLADRVDHESRQGLAVDVLGHNQSRLVRRRNLLQQREEVRQGGDLLAHEQHLGVFQDGLLSIHVGDEVRGQVALVEGHTLGNRELGGDGLRTPPR